MSIKPTNFDMAEIAKKNTETPVELKTPPIITPEMKESGKIFRQALQSKNNPEKTKKEVKSDKKPAAKSSKRAQPKQTLATPKAPLAKDNQGDRKKDKTTAAQPTSTQAPADASAASTQTPPVQAQPKITPVQEQQMVAMVEQVSKRILLARSDGAQNVTIRIDLNEDLLPQTHLTAQKQPDGTLKLTFVTDSPEATYTIQTLHAGMTQHLKATQNIAVRIDLTNAQGQSVMDASAKQSSTRGQNPSQNQGQNRKPDWESVEDRIKEE